MRTSGSGCAKLRGSGARPPGAVTVAQRGSPGLRTQRCVSRQRDRACWPRAGHTAVLVAFAWRDDEH